jgi:hypothetical protein
MPPEAPLPLVESTKNEARESASANVAQAAVAGASAEPARLPTFASEVRSIEHASLRPSRSVHGSPLAFLAVPLPAELGLQHASAGRRSW